MRDIIKSLTEIYENGGGSEQIYALIKERIVSYCDKVYTDRLGNLVARKLGDGQRLMIAAPCAQCGAVVTSVEDSGVLRYAPLSVSAAGFLNKTVCFPGGIRGTVCIEKSCEPKDISHERMFIDIGASDKAEAEKLAKLGDICTAAESWSEQGGFISGSAVSCAAKCAILIDIIEAVKNSPYDLYFVFAASSPYPDSGLKSGAYEIEPEIAFTLSCMDSGELPGADKTNIRTGAGPVLRLLDKNAVADRMLAKAVLEAAADSDIKIQTAANTTESTAAAVLQSVRCGVRTADIAVPVRAEGCKTLLRLSDAEAAARLITAILSVKAVNPT